MKQYVFIMFKEFFQNISIYIPKYSNWTIIFCDSHFKSHFQCTVECWQSNYRLNCVTHTYVGVEFASVEQTYYDIDCHCTYFGRFTLPFGVINRLLSIHILMNWNKLHNWTLWFDHVVLNRIKKSYSNWKKSFLQKKSLLMEIWSATLNMHGDSSFIVWNIHRSQMIV